MMPASSPTDAPPSHDLDDLLDRGFRYALSLSHDRSDAEDLVQDAAMALVAKGTTWEPSYLFATIRNRFIDHYRRGQCVSFVSLESDTTTAEAVPAFVADEIEPFDCLEAAHLHQALGRLRDDEREMLFLAVVEGFTAEEISRLTDRPRGTVLSLIFRAKRKLRGLLRAGQERSPQRDPSPSRFISTESRDRASPRAS